MQIDKLMKHLICGLAALSSIAAIPAAHATDAESVERLRTTTLNLIQMLVEQGVLSKEKAEAFIKQAEEPKEPVQAKAGDSAQDAAPKDDQKEVRVQYVPESVQRRLREDIKQEVMVQAKNEGWAAPGLPGWLNRIGMDGDVRLRFEQDIYPQGNETPQNLAIQGIDNVNNTSKDINRLRLRARLGVHLKISDEISGGLRLSTGSANNPISSNQTLGGDYTTSGKFVFGVDRAYIKYAPNPWLSFSGGRLANPWMNTDLVWASDFAFDGVVAAAQPRISENLTGFVTLGAFPLQLVEQTSNATGAVQANNRWLYGAQTGLEWITANESAYKMGLAYYDYTNIEGVLNDLSSTSQNLTARQFHQKGNTVFDITNPQGSPLTDLYGLASKFREVDFTGSVDIADFNPVHVVLTGDYVKNVGFNLSDVLAKNPTNPVGGNTGWMGKVLVGMPETLYRGDWNVSATYKYLETNAVLDSFTDSDFHLGGTNAKGWIVGGNYGIDKNTWLNLRWLSSDQIVGSTLAIDVLLLDLNTKF